MILIFVVVVVVLHVTVNIIKNNIFFYASNFSYLSKFIQINKKQQKNLIYTKLNNIIVTYGGHLIIRIIIKQNNTIQRKLQ